LTRRRFLQGTGTGLGLLVLPAFLGRNGLLFASPGKAMGRIAPDLDHTYFAESFGIDGELIHKAMKAAMASGGDFADLYFQHLVSNYVGLEDGDVNRAYTSVDLGVGIRVVVGDQTGYAFTEELTAESIVKTAQTAASIAKGKAGKLPETYKIAGHRNYYPIETAWESLGIDRKIPFLETINKGIFAKDTRVVKASITFADNTSRILVANSDGLAVEDYLPGSYLGARVTAEQDGRRESNGYNVAGRRDIGSFTKDVIDDIANISVERTVALFEAVQPPAGEMPVVLAAGESGILLHEAIGHGMEADFNRKEISIYSDMIDRKICNDKITIVDDGTNLNMRGSINVDDEGNPSQRTVLVDKGILRTYMHDRISAQHYGVKPTGSGRRQSFRHKPLPRMRNTYMEAGPDTEDEIVRSVKKGIYAVNFTNGQVQIGAGDFSFYVAAGYMIEDGKLTAPVKDINLIGNGPKALENVSMVGNELKLAIGGWTCGKSGQRVPVSMGQPAVKIDTSITVGGTRG
jgi:TldD protein